MIYLSIAAGKTRLAVLLEFLMTGQVTLGILLATTPCRRSRTLSLVPTREILVETGVLEQEGHIVTSLCIGTDEVGNHLVQFVSESHLVTGHILASLVFLLPAVVLVTNLVAQARPVLGHVAHAVVSLLQRGSNDLVCLNGSIQGIESLV